MKKTKDFKQKALEVLKGKWLTAVLATLVASILGGIGSYGISINADFSNSDIKFNVFGKEAGSVESFINSGFFMGFLSYVLIIGLCIAVVYFILGSFVGVGYAKFRLNMIDRKEASVNNLFDYFSYWKLTALTKFLKGLYVFLWSLLLVIPGILASLSYSMTEFVLAENPELTANEAIAKSKEMMYGNRFRFFCLELSFIGWAILSVFTFGIGNLWLMPYSQTAYAAFYRDLKGESQPEYYTY